MIAFGIWLREPKRLPAVEDLLKTLVSAAPPPIDEADLVLSVDDKDVVLRGVRRSSPRGQTAPAGSCAEKNPFIKNGTDRGWAHGFVRSHMATPAAVG